MNGCLLIRDIYAGEVLDREGNPAIEIKVLAGDDNTGSTVISHGGNERITDRQQEQSVSASSRMKQMKKEIEQAAQYINEIVAQMLIDRNVFEQTEIDCILSDLIEGGRVGGADVCFGISAAAARAAASALNLPFYKYLGGMGKNRVPVPLIDLFDTPLFQNRKNEQIIYMLVPNEKSETIYDWILMCKEIQWEMYGMFREDGIFCMDPFFQEKADVREVYFIVEKACSRAGYRMGRDVCLAYSAALSERCDRTEKADLFECMGKHKMELMIMDLSDFQTVTELFESARQYGDGTDGRFLCVKNGRQSDNLAADVGTALGADYFMGGSVHRGENVVIYNRMLQIEKQIIRTRCYRVARPGCC